MNFKNVTIVFAVVAVLLAASGGIYFVASGGLDRAELIYHGNGGLDDGIDTVQTHQHIVWGTSFEKDGYILDSWNTSADGSGTSYKVGDYVNYDKTINIYAQWVDMALYNSVCVSSYNDESDLYLTMTLHYGSQAVELNKYTYVVTKEDTACITLDAESEYWDITTDGIKGFVGEYTDDIGNAYCLVISVTDSNNLYVDENNKMWFTVTNTTSLNIYMFQMDLVDVLTDY